MSASTPLAPPNLLQTTARLDLLPGELLKIIVEQEVCPRQLAHPLFQFKQIPRPLIDSIRTLDCTEVTPTTFAAMAIGIASLPNLEAVNISCPALHTSLNPPARTSRHVSSMSSSSSDSSDSETELVVSSGTQPVNHMPWPLDSWSAREAKAMQALSIKLAQATVRQNNLCFKRITLEHLKPPMLKQTLDLFANPASLTSLSLASWSSFYNTSNWSYLQALSLYPNLTTLNVAVDDGTGPEPTRLQAFPRLSSVRDLAICGHSPRVMRVVNHIAPYAAKLKLVYRAPSPSPAYHLANLPSLRELDLRTSWRHISVLSAFSTCTALSTLSWVEMEDSSYRIAGHGRVTLARLLRLEQLDTSLRIIRFTPRCQRAWAPEELQELSEVCRDRGASLEVKLGGDDAREMPADQAAQAASMQDTLAWASTHVEGLARLGDTGGLKEMWDVLDEARQRQAVALA